MSTGADCRFVEKTAGNWYYELQQWPYGSNPDYDTFGPFLTFRAAMNHLDRNHANPGGFSLAALPGCKHDLLRGGWSSLECDRCGDGWGDGEACPVCGEGRIKVNTRATHDERVAIECSGCKKTWKGPHG